MTGAGPLKHLEVTLSGLEAFHSDPREDCEEPQLKCSVAPSGVSGKLVGAGQEQVFLPGHPAAFLSFLVWEVGGVGWGSCLSA